MDKNTKSNHPRRKYDEEFKTEALRMVSAGRSAAEVARSLGIGENLLYKWKAERKSTYSPEETGQDAEVERLRKALRQVETERDISAALGVFTMSRAQ